jgi:hypothetical protein
MIRRSIAFFLTVATAALSLFVVIPATAKELKASTADQNSKSSSEGPVTKTDQEQVKEGIEAAKENPPHQLQAGRKTFSFNGHSFSITLPEGWWETEVVNGDSKHFMFLTAGPEIQNKAALTVAIYGTDLSVDSLPAGLIVNGMLHPYRQRLAKYQEKVIFIPISGGGFSGGSEYSGMLSDTIGLHGFATSPGGRKGCVFLLTATGKEDCWEGESKKILATLASFKIEE